MQCFYQGTLWEDPPAASRHPNRTVQDQGGSTNDPAIAVSATLPQQFAHPTQSQVYGVVTQVESKWVVNILAGDLQLHEKSYQRQSAALKHLQQCLAKVWDLPAPPVAIPAGIHDQGGQPLQLGDRIQWSPRQTATIVDWHQPSSSLVIQVGTDPNWISMANPSHVQKLQASSVVFSVGMRVICREHPYAMDDWIIQSIRGKKAKCYSPATKEVVSIPLTELEIYSSEKAFPVFKPGEFVVLANLERWGWSSSAGHVLQVKYQHINGMVPVIDVETHSEPSYHCTDLVRV